MYFAYGSCPVQECRHLYHSNWACFFLAVVCLFFSCNLLSMLTFNKLTLNTGCKISCGNSIRSSSGWCGPLDLPLFPAVCLQACALRPADGFWCCPCAQPCARSDSLVTRTRASPVAEDSHYSQEQAAQDRCPRRHTTKCCSSGGEGGVKEEKTPIPEGEGGREEDGD